MNDRFLFVGELSGFRDFVNEVNGLLVTFRLGEDRIRRAKDVLLSIFFDREDRSGERVFGTFRRYRPLFAVDCQVGTPILYFLDLAAKLFFFDHRLFVAFAGGNQRDYVAVRNFRFPVLFELGVFGVRLPISSRYRYENLCSSSQGRLPVLPVFCDVRPHNVRPRRPIAGDPKRPHLVG